RTGRRTAPGAGPDHRRSSPGGLRRRLCPPDGGPAPGVARGRLTPHRVPDPAPARRPAVRPAPRAASLESEVGPAVAAPPPGRPRRPTTRTGQAPWVTMSLLRLTPFRLEAEGEVDWWFRPPWDPKKARPSVLDVERLFGRHRPEIQQHLSDWLGVEREVA